MRELFESIYAKLRAHSENEAEPRTPFRASPVRGGVTVLSFRRAITSAVSPLPINNARKKRSPMLHPLLAETLFAERVLGVSDFFRKDFFARISSSLPRVYLCDSFPLESLHGSISFASLRAIAILLSRFHIFRFSLSLSLESLVIEINLCDEPNAAHASSWNRRFRQRERRRGATPLPGSLRARVRVYVYCQQKYLAAWHYLKIDRRRFETVARRERAGERNLAARLASFNSTLINR